MTGGIAENIVLKPQSTDISSVLAHLLKLTSIILCKVEAKNAEDVSFTSEFLYKTEIFKASQLQSKVLALLQWKLLEIFWKIFWMFP